MATSPCVTLTEETLLAARRDVAEKFLCVGTAETYGKVGNCECSWFGVFAAFMKLDALAGGIGWMKIGSTFIVA